MPENNKKTGVSRSRRDLLKKAAYVPPALIALGMLIPVAGNAASLGGPPNPPESPGSNPSPRKKPPG